MRSRRSFWRSVFFYGAAYVLIHPFGAFCAGPETAMERLSKVQVLDLDTAAEVALIGNPSLAAAQARVQQAAEVVKQAWAPYWPQLDASASVSRVKLSERDYIPQNALITAFNPGTSLNNPEEYYKAGLSASWLIFNGFARKFNLAAARYGEKASVSARFDTERLLLSAVTANFLQAQLAQENIAIAKADEAFNQRQLVEARLRYDVGTGSLSDVLNFQVRVNSAKSLLIQQERVLQTNLISLAALMGLPGSNFPEQVRLAELAPLQKQEMVIPQVPQLIETAVQLRPDLQQYEWNTQRAQAAIKQAQAGYYPTLSLVGNYDGQRPEDIHFENDDFGNTVGVGLSWNLFAGGLTRARVGEARAREIEVKKATENLSINVASEVRTSSAQIESAQRQLTLQEENTRLVQQQRDLVEKEYKAGVGSLVRLNEAQRDLTVAQAQLASARVALRVSWYDLLTATGEILGTFGRR